MRTNIHDLVDEQIKRSQLMRHSALGVEESHVPLAPGPVITISRQPGSGGAMVARRLAERLGWGLWDKDLVDAIAKDAEVSRRVVESFDEKTVSEIEVLVRAITGQPEIGAFMYRRHLVHALLSIARHGNAVILGRGANYILADALNVRIVASERLRMQNLMKWHDLSEAEAHDRIHKSGRERADFIRHTYDRDLDDPLAYDLTITMDMFSIDRAVEIIIAALGNAECGMRSAE